MICVAPHRVILPGVGAAAEPWNDCTPWASPSVIPTLTQPRARICLGMQLLFAGSEEGDTACLGILPARVHPLSPIAKVFRCRTMGWNQIVPGRITLTRGLGDDAYVYFVPQLTPPGGP